MRRRQFIKLLSAAAVSFGAIRAKAQDKEPLIGVLLGSPEQADFESLLDTFSQSLEKLGWVEGRNVRVHVRWTGVDPKNRSRIAREMVALHPDVIFAAPSNVVIALQRETRTIPIVFTNVSDPIAQGVVDNLARPSGNLTGFSNLEPSLMGKWLQILKEAAPGLKRVGLMIGTVNAASPIWYRMFKEAAPILAIEPLFLPVKEIKQIDDAVRTIAAEPHSAMMWQGTSCCPNLLFAR